MSARTLPAATATTLPSWPEFNAKHRGLINRLINRHSGLNDAESVIQEAFVLCLRDFDPSRAQFQTHVFNRAGNMCMQIFKANKEEIYADSIFQDNEKGGFGLRPGVDYFAAEQQQLEIEQRDESELSELEIDELEEREELATTERARAHMLAKLSEQEREVAELIAFQGHTVKSIADAWGCTQRHIQATLKRALDKLTKGQGQAVQFDLFGGVTV